MAKTNYIVDSCYRHGMTKFHEVVITLDCDAAGEVTSTDSWLECIACEEENEEL